MKFGSNSTSNTGTQVPEKNLNNKIMSNETNSNPNAVSRIAEGMSITKGEIVSTHDIRFDGNFDGKITSKGRIVIGESATLKGEIICANLDVWGVYEGVSYVQDTLSLKKGGSYSGEINTGKFVVEIGSKLDGTTKMISDEDFQKIIKDNPYLKSAEAPKPSDPQNIKK